jgi:antitoxin VapB
MALNIKDPEAERLATEVAAMTGETKTRAVRVALQERRERLALRGAASGRAAGLVRFLEEEAWPQIPENVLGATVSREEREGILGYGPSGG